MVVVLLMVNRDNRNSNNHRNNIVRRRRRSNKHINMKNITIEHLISWMLAIILFWFFAINGYPKISGADPVAHQFESWGYTEGFAFFIGCVEVFGAVLVLIPRTAFWGALLLLFILLGAMYTHIIYEPDSLPPGVGSFQLTITLLIFTIAQLFLTRGGRLNVYAQK